MTENMLPFENVLHFLYLPAAACFILSLKWLSSVPTARRGVLFGVIGNAAGGRGGRFSIPALCIMSISSEPSSWARPSASPWR